MKLKTQEVAKELGMAPRTIRKWVKKYDIPCSKNDYGHYVYDEKAISFLESLKASSEIAGTLDIYETSIEMKDLEDTNISPVKKEHSMSELMERIERTEWLLDQKADEVVSYQLLQQRKEIEDLTKRIQELEDMMINLQEPAKKYEPPLILDQPMKMKRRGMFRSIFGL
ncbi:MerR family transcriptional regulator [Sutcliffiella deserti]|uniref:MerR family transcriptional regulator n=1 Tax=Sutcliffiella deserti TaxID=2875501 RepID=UPI001CBC8EBD|nr:MerR family transcriptional regulator [Sutcliffiella deserti]